MSAVSRASGKKHLCKNKTARYDVLTAVLVKTQVSWDMKSVSFCEKFPTFGRNLVTSFSGSSSRRRMIFFCLPVVSLRKRVKDRGFCSCHSEIRFTRKTLQCMTILLLEVFCILTQRRVCQQLSLRCNTKLVGNAGLVQQPYSYLAFRSAWLESRLNYRLL